MANKKKLPTEHLTRSQLLEYVQNAITEYQQTTGAILDSYRDLIHTQKDFDGMVTELGAADVCLDKAISDLDDETDMDTVIADLNTLQDDNSLETDRLLPFITSKGYAYVKCQTFAQRDALEHFVTTELYPLYADQDNYLII
jgi:hypothetical protein